MTYKDGCYIFGNLFSQNQCETSSVTINTQLELSQGTVRFKTAVVNLAKIRVSATVDIFSTN